MRRIGIVLVVGVAFATGAAAAVLPTLGANGGHGQKGFGLVRPASVSLGGDPSGFLTQIHWKSWGGAQAVGIGTGTWVWPGTSVASNRPTAGARVVAFNLGSCRGARSYNAVEWFWPEYDEKFDAKRSISTCPDKP